MKVEALHPDTLQDFWRFVMSRQPGLVERFAATHPVLRGESPALPKVLIAIPTCFQFDYGEYRTGNGFGDGLHKDGENSQTQAVRDTWFRDAATMGIDGRFFFGKPPGGFPRQPLPDEVFLDCADDYAHLPEKVQGICCHVVKGGYEYAFKCDTDTAVNVGLLAEELLSLPKGTDYAGRCHGAGCSGGAGYWLSRTAAALVAEAPVGHWAEDVGVGKVMARYGIGPIHLRGHKLGGQGHLYFPRGFDPTCLQGDEVTMNALTPDDMRAWHAWRGRK
jgi:hypothetical protein